MDKNKKDIFEFGSFEVNYMLCAAREMPLPPAPSPLHGEGESGGEYVFSKKQLYQFY